MKTTDYNGGITALQEFLQTDWVENIKATSLTQGAFNDVEGYQYTIIIKVTGKRISDTKKYKGSMFKIHTNSTYIDEITAGGTDKQQLAEFNEFISLMG